MNVEWYEGTVMNIGRGKAGGEIVKVIIEYDDSVEEECDWPDDDVILDIGENEEEETKDKKRRKGKAVDASPKDVYLWRGRMQV